MTTADPTAAPDPRELFGRVQRLGLFGLLASWNEIAAEPWIERLVTLEEQERKRRSLERRLKTARIGNFKPIADFDWTWPKRVDREALEDLFSLRFVEEGFNAVLLGPNGVGKTMVPPAMSAWAIFGSMSWSVRPTSRQVSAPASSRQIPRHALPLTKGRRYGSPDTGSTARSRLNIVTLPLLWSAPCAMFDVRVMIVR